jgi:hypothetical protein
MSLYAKVKTSTNIIESVGDDNTAEAGYHFKEFYPHIAWGSELVGFEVSTEPTTAEGFPHDNLFIE